jgi:crossover junction endodeoxyribonuclease RuvC
VILIGIDTALRCTGYGVLELEGKTYLPTDCGVIKNKPKIPVSECLHRLGGGIEEIVESYKPSVAALEGGFYFKNAQTAMVLGMARGTVVSILAKHGIPIYEYAPRKAKQAVVGNGNASKQQVALCIAQMLNLNLQDIPNDSTDAMALAICHTLISQSGNGIYLKPPL